MAEKLIVESPYKTGNKDEIILFTLYDLEGNKLIVNQIPSDGILEIDVSQIPNNVYLYVIQSNIEILKRGKIIKRAS